MCVVILNVAFYFFVMLNVIMLRVFYLIVIILSVIILSVIILSVIILSVIILSVIILSVIILSVVILSVVALNVMLSCSDILLIPRSAFLSLIQVWRANNITRKRNVCQGGRRYGREG
jgi:hypothetical protein